MKILVTGGNGKFAKALKNHNSELYHTPGRPQLNLLEPESIKQYTSTITEVDGIILNAISVPQVPTDWFDEQQVKEFYNLFNLYLSDKKVLKSSDLKVLGEKEIPKAFKKAILVSSGLIPILTKSSSTLSISNSFLPK